MRGRGVAILLLLVVLALVGFVSRQPPFEAIGAFVLLALGSAAGLALLVALGLLLHSLLFERSAPRGRRFN